MVSPAELVQAALGSGLDLIVVCDHDTMAAAAEVRARGEAVGLAVVCGMEVTTRWPQQTHLLGWFLERPVRSGMSLEETVDAIHDQGGLVVVPHPFMPTYFASCQPAALAGLVQRRRLDGIELLFPAPLTARRRRALQDFYLTHADRLGAALGASDSHFGGYDLGRALTEFEGHTAEDFRVALLQRRTRPLPGYRVRVPAGLVLRQQWRSLVRLPLRRLRGQLQ